MQLTDKQRRFIDLYVIPGTDGALNATRAYRGAYPNCKSDRAAEAAASRLLSNVIVRAEIDARLKAIAAVTGMTAEQTWREYRYIAESDIDGWIDFSGIKPKLRPANQVSQATRRATKSVEVKHYTEGTGEDARDVQLMKFTFWDKPTALTVRLKALGEIKEHIEHSGEVGTPAKPVTPEQGAKIVNAMMQRFWAMRNKDEEDAERLAVDDGGGTSGGDGSGNADSALVAPPGDGPDSSGDGDGAGQPLAQP